MKIKELGGEFALIDRIKKDPKNANVKIGIGDDCAAVKINENTYHVYTTDMLVENDHFSLRYFSPYDIGWKAMISNVSDIASAGGKVLYALVAISLKSDATVELVDGIYEGIYAASERYGFDVIGGDTTHGELMTICITLVGEVSAADMKLRSGAKAGEILKLTAPIGGSTAGLRLFLKNIEGYEDVKRYHLHPECAMDLVPVIVPYATAMTDISDGLASEARNIAKARAQESRYRPIGICLYCSEPLSKDLRWCDSDCRDDFFKYDVKK